MQPGPKPFKPRVIKDDDLYGDEGYKLKLVKPGFYQFQSKGMGSHVYLILGDRMNVLIDSGLISKFKSFNYLLTTEIGLRVEDINLIINTHEHIDHISCNCYFKCLIAAHRWAATKIQHMDELIVNARKWSVDISDFHVEMWLEDRNVFDLGNIVLKVVETPGHTSGSICLFEPYKKFMFTGDTLFKGALSNVYESGSIAEVINSLQILNSLHVEEFFPGHGPAVTSMSEVKQELATNIAKAKDQLSTFISRIKINPLEDAVVPKSLYDREGNE